MEDLHTRAGGSRRRSFRRLTVLLFLVNAVILTGLVVVAYALDVLDGPELDTIDARFEIRGDQGPAEDVVVVEIDDVSFSELGETWPFPRSLHAQAVERLRRAGAKVIAYDIQFTEPTVPREDNALIGAVDRATGSTGVVLATTEVEQGGQTNVFGGDQVVRQAGARAGSSNYVNDSDGVIRRLPYTVEGLESFAIVAAEEFRGRRLPVREGREWIDFRGPPGTIESVPFSRLVEGRVPPELFRDKVVVIGATAPSLQDVHPTAVGGDAPMSGPEIQANAIATALAGFPLQHSSGAVDVLLIVLLGMVGPGIALWLGPLRAAVAGAVLAALFAVAVQLAFNSGLIVSFLYPLASLLLGVVGALAIGLVLGAFERERVRDVFSRFVPEPVVDDVLKNVGDDLRRHPRARRHARDLHGRRDHGGVRRADPDGRPCRPRARRGARDGGTRTRALQRVDAHAWPRRRIQDRHRPEQRGGGGGKRGVGAAARVHGDRGHHQHRVANRGNDQGHAAQRVRLGVDPAAAAGTTPGPGARGR